MAEQPPARTHEQRRDAVEAKAASLQADLEGHVAEDTVNGVHGIQRQGAVAAAQTVHSLGALYDDTQVEAALNALGTRVNELQDRLRDAGIIES